ncbi:MAG: glycosyl transferase family protein [Rhodospirillaceae bacterium]|nr:glycosyl transferase family protein [Rhodospirillaceae bacterium]
MTLESFNFAVAQYMHALEWGAVLISIVILLSSLDDLFIDICYWAREFYRVTYMRLKHKPFDMKVLLKEPERPIAIMVPAWQEYAVIAQMIEHNVAILEYSNFKIFCGSYPNDTKTGEVIDAMARRYKHVVHVRVPHDGPTCKADCLNWIIQSIFLHEEQHDMKFAGIVVHDSEDVVHPLELKLFNFLLPRKDFIQLPVLSLERPWWSMVGGTYLDDFAEWHSKDLAVRESLIGEVPSAGVGTCFSRRAIGALADETNQQPFNTDSLTEDYDFSYRLANLGMKQVFVRMPVSYTSKRRTLFTRREYEVEVQSMIAVREFFPDSFRAAYRQRARWIYGIAFQGWLEMGWKGNWGNKYMLLRDRKGVVTSFVTIVAYVLMANFMLVAAYADYFNVQLFSDVIGSHPWMQEILAANFFLLCNRVGQRFYFVSSMYGTMHGLAALPRMVVNNIINFFAASRAWKLFFMHVVFGQGIAWDKTDHVYPSLNNLKESKRRLGDLLLSWKSISQEQLANALMEQSKTNEHLGKVLLREGWINEETLAEILAYQNDLPRGTFEPNDVVSHRDLLPLELIVRHRILPAGKNEKGEVIVLAAAALSEPIIADINAATGIAPHIMIVKESEVTKGLQLLTHKGAGADGTKPKPLLGDLLVDLGFCRRQDLTAALQQYSPVKDGRFGDFLVATGLLEQANLQTALERQAALATA